MKKALLLSLAVIISALIFSIQQSQSKYVYITNSEQAVQHFLGAYPQEVGSLDSIEVYRWPIILRPGYVLEEALLSSASPIRVNSPSWFFFVDLQPGTLYQHPTQFVLIKQSGGKLEVHARNTNPKLNGVRLFSTPAERQNRVLRIEALEYLDPIALDAFMDHESHTRSRGGAAAPLDNTGFHGSHVPDKSQINFSEYRRTSDESQADFERRILGFLETPQSREERVQNLEGCAVSCAEPGKKLALIIEGGDVNETPSRLAAQYLTSMGYAIHRLSSNASEEDVLQHIYPTDLKNIEAGFRWLESEISGCCDEVLILIHAHGSPAGEMEMNPLRERFIYDPSTGRPTDAVKEVGREAGGYLNTRELKAYLNRLRSCKVKVFVQSCFAGSLLEGGLNVLPEADDLGCLCRVVAVSATARQSARESGYFSFVRGLSGGRGFTGAYEALWNWTQGPLQTELQRLQRQQLPQVSATIDLYCSDADGDGLCYGEEVLGGYSDPERPDTDEDGLSDSDEKAFGSDPRNPDTDQDGVGDQTEKFGGTQPDNPDSDGDSVPDGKEYELGLNPNSKDSDGDGFDDEFEIKEQTDPLNIESYPGSQTTGAPLETSDNGGE